MEPVLCPFHHHFFHHHASPHKGMKSNSWTLLATTILLTLLSSLPLLTSAQECNNTIGCFPPTGNLALGRTVNVSSTCTAGSEYCVFLSPGPDCFPCSPESTHSSRNINDDDTSTIWISEIGSGSLNTTLRLDFEAPLLFEGMTIVFQSLRPTAMILERSSDFGQSWQVYRYYSTSCVSTFGRSDTFVRDNLVFTTTEPICTSVESDLFPFTNGEVTFSTSQHLPPDTDSELALSYQTVTNLRVHLLGQFEELEISGPMYQYYSISEWIVNGQCMCNGHASMCMPQAGEEIAINKVYTGCACSHNTAGNNCDECQVGFNNAPWLAGTQAEANACEECVCNGHASDCEYLPAQSSAMCLDCSDNTTGDQCEQCLPTFYQDPILMFNDPDICRACDCDPAGVSDDGQCNSSGQCNCKVNVELDVCNQCEDGYWDLAQDNPVGCQECDCNPAGAVLSSENNLPLCNKTSGECFCMENVHGSRCDLCMPGYFNIDAGCVPCDCNMGGSESQVCEQDSSVLQCPCKPNIGLSTCSSPLPGYYVRPLDDIIFEAEETQVSEDAVLVFPIVGTTSPFTGRGFVTINSGTNLEFILTVPEDSQYEVILRYEATLEIESVILRLFNINPTSLNFDCETSSLSMNVSRVYNVTLSPGDRHIVIDSVCLLNGVQYGLSLSYNSQEWLLDSVLLLPDFRSTSDYYASQTAPFQQDIIEPCLPREASNDPLPLQCQQETFTLSTEFHTQSVLFCDCDLLGSGGLIGSGTATTCADIGGQCEVCQPGVTGRLCDTCLNGWFGFSLGECQDCGCDIEGSVNPVCDIENGQCDCQPGVGGRTCDQCLPGFFNLTSQGCTPCDCSGFATSEECNGDGQCNCPYGIGDLKCTQCNAGFYNISVDGCLECNCDPLGSTLDVCDVNSGQCTCTGGSVGQDCSLCPDRFFVTDSLIRERCVRCVCSGRSETCVVDETNFALAAVQSNFSDLCSTDPLECSDGWQLLTASGSSAAPYGPNDANGLTYILLFNDFPMLYAPERYLGNRQASYGLNFTFVVRITTSGAINENTTIARMVGALFDQTLIGIFPFPQVIENGFGAERYLTYSIPFLEEYWHVGNMTGRNPTFFEFLSVLSNITQFSYTGQYTGELIEYVHIVNISFEFTIPLAEMVTNSTSPDDDTTLLNTTQVTVIRTSFPSERCVCPQAYQGSSCTDCARGYARSSDNILDPCTECECNNQTLDCDPNTGECIDCQGNTEGFNCDRCIPGYYGDPTRGIPCEPCECPLVGNSFSPTCFLDSDGLQTCNNCALEYTGRNCDMCMDGYFGNPFMGICNDCNCNGNVDPALGPVCNTTTGQCLNCLNNTTGYMCDVCIPGYYGDVPRTPCQPCQCNPNGTIGDCDRISGDCQCQPDATGTLCDECVDTYWGLSQGLGCIPCDCCTGNGSTSEICNKDTGACDCLPNVGSVTDNQCCMCTPGYFNLQSDIGCESCNCSSLAVSESCDQMSGRCECQDGAIGLKCDDCAFGYTGQVPNCERCHDCFFQWPEIISNLSEIVNNLQYQIDTLISTYYNNHTVTSVQTEIMLLLDQLRLANQTLNNITIQETDIDNLNQVLSYVNASILRFGERVVSIQDTLRLAEMMLNESFAFDGSFNMTFVEELRMELRLHNNTVATHIANVNMSLTLLTQAENTANLLWSDLDALNTSIQNILVSLREEEADVYSAMSSFTDYQNVYNSLRSSLSSLDEHANSVNAQLDVLNEVIVDASQDAYALNASVLNLNDEVTDRQEEAMAALEAARQINDSVTSAQNIAESALNMITQLEGNTGDAINIANVTLENITGTLSGVNDSIHTLIDVKELVQSVLGIPIPSLEYAATLAAQIEENALPQDVINEIVQNATRSRAEAERALNTIRNASDAVQRAQSLVTGLQSDINTTITVQAEVNQTIPSLQEVIGGVQNDLDEIDDVASQVNRTVQNVEASVEGTQAMIESAETLGETNQRRSNSLTNQSAGLETQVEQHRNDVNTALSNYGALQNEINATQQDVESTLQSASDLNTDADNLNAMASTISLEQLLALSREYDNEIAAVQNLNTRVQSTREEVDQLTTSLNSAAQRLQQCYRTP